METTELAFRKWLRLLFAEQLGNKIDRRQQDRPHTRICTSNQVDATHRGRRVERVCTSARMACHAGHAGKYAWYWQTHLAELWNLCRYMLRK